MGQFIKDSGTDPTETATFLFILYVAQLEENETYEEGDFKNKQTTKQLFEQENNCSNNCLSSKTIIISIKLFHQE